MNINTITMMLILINNNITINTDIIIEILNIYIFTLKFKYTFHAEHNLYLGQILLKPVIKRSTIQMDLVFARTFQRRFL